MGSAGEERILLISGASGAGKTTVAERLLRDPRYGRARTATTRLPRPGEVNGKDYDFLSEEGFRAGVARGDFVEHAVVYGHLYGTPRANLAEVHASGRRCVLVVDVQGAESIRRLALPADTVFVDVPDLDTLRQRLEGRGKDGEEIVARRLEAAEKERAEAEHFDLVLVNDDIEAAVRRLVAHFGLDWTPLAAEE